MNFDEALRGASEGSDAPFQEYRLYDPKQMPISQLANLADFGFLKWRGLRRLGRPEQEEPYRPHQEVKDWIAHFINGKRVNAAFFDTTTLVTVDRLINASEPAEYLAPETLLDLSTFVNGVVFFDRIFHFENPHIDTRTFNEALGNEVVFVDLPLEDFETDEDSFSTQGVRGALLDIGYEASFWNRRLRQSQESELGAEDKQLIRRDWELLLGRRLTTDEVFPKRALTNPQIPITGLDWTPSNGPRLLEALIGETKRDKRHAYTSFDQAAETERFILECNHRSVFNFLVGYFLELPYVPSVARVPFHRFLYERAQTVQRHLATVQQIETEHRRAVDAYFTPSSNNLVLPFLLAVVLTQISSLSEFFEKLAEVRQQAEPLRRRRAELDEALQMGDIQAAKQLRSAFEQDAANLRTMFQFAPVAGGLAAVLAALGSATPTLIMATVGVLTIGSLAPADVLQSLQARAFRPQFWVLSQMTDTAHAMTDLLPRVGQLWGERSVRESQAFVERFDRLKGLQYG